MPMLTPVQLLLLTMAVPVLIASLLAWVGPLQDRHPNPSS